jgi:hypothetical protein
VTRKALNAARDTVSVGLAFMEAEPEIARHMGASLALSLPIERIKRATGAETELTLDGATAARIEALAAAHELTEGDVIGLAQAITRASRLGLP